MDPRDPIQRVADGSRDLYDVVEWEPRSPLDRLSVSLYAALVTAGRALVVILALLIVGAQLALTWAAVTEQPDVAAYILLSVVPALGLVLYVYRADVTSREPLTLLVATFLLGFAFAGFAAVLNTSFRGLFGHSIASLAVFFFLIVGPVEETVKWLAVRLYAYRSVEFDAVVDGAVYGAVAGLGFATIENAIYITGQYVAIAGSGASVLDATVRTAAIRTFAGPGHVIYSGFAGYYLGLAKFNPGRRGPIVVKGLVVAAVVHATYNTLATNLFEIAGALGLAGIPDGVLFVGFVVLYDSVFGYALYRKIAAYRRAYVAVGADRIGEPVTAVDRDEFVWDRRDSL